VDSQVDRLKLKNGRKVYKCNESNRNVGKPTRELYFIHVETVTTAL